ncbi:MAG: ribosome recycling factor [Oscillospiraceae bacterium]|nr:ribosome recycling factor [Oscillospiraceae bacterium]
MTKAYEDRMSSAVKHLESEYSSIRAGRANPGVLDKVTVSYYGTDTPINQVATVSVTEARTLSIQPWDRSLLKPVVKAIQMSDIGINPIDDGISIRLVFPAPTEERRKALVKDVSKLAEEAKVAVRNIRRDAMDKFKAAKKANELTEDDQKKLEEKMQKITDKFIKTIDEVAAKKSKEVMEL